MADKKHKTSLQQDDFGWAFACSMCIPKEKNFGFQTKDYAKDAAKRHEQLKNR